MRRGRTREQDLPRPTYASRRALYSSVYLTDTTIVAFGAFEKKYASDASAAVSLMRERGRGGGWDAVLAGEIEYVGGGDGNLVKRELWRNVMPTFKLHSTVLLLSFS